MEVALWVLVVVLALSLRLARLDAAPLNLREAREAMLSWRAVTLGDMPQANYSPLLFALNAVLFSLCGSSDVIARLWPALFGSALTLAPFLFRRQIGRIGALATGLYLAFSPTALLASRQLDGTVVAALGGMLFLGGVIRFVNTENRRWLWLAAGGLALAVTSSSSAFGLLLALGGAGLLVVWSWPKVWQQVSNLNQVLGVFVLALLAFSTGLSWNLAGASAVGDLLLAWIARFGTESLASPFALLIVYEPLALLFGLGGVLWSVWRGRRFGTLLGLWAGLGGVLLAMMPGRLPLDISWVVLPLALLTGLVAETLVQGLREHGEGLSEGLYVPVVLILWVHTYLVLVRYAQRGQPADLLLALLVIILQVLLGVMFVFAVRIEAALRGAAAGVGIVLLGVTLSASWGVAYVRPADPRELLVHEPTAVEVRDLVATVRELSWRETGMPMTLPVVVKAEPDSVLAWYTRDFSAARQVVHLAPDETSPALVTSRNDELSLAVDYVGQDFVLQRSWDPAEIRCTIGWPPQCSASIEWLLLRRTPSAPVATRWAELWLQPDLLAIGE
jgi:uncharacterized protein (TIGR03663 family)